MTTSSFAAVFNNQPWEEVTVCMIKHGVTCGMMVSRDLRSWSPILARSTPSISILSPALSRIRNKVDDQLPLKKMRVRDKDVPYMTTGWKQAIRAKRRATVKYKNHPTQENWENKKKCRNEATRQRRLAIKEHWKKKADDLKANPRDFFKTFRPFLSTKGHQGDIEIHLRTDGDVVEKDQSRVADLFADYFATIADGIGGDKSKLDSPEDFQDHPSVAAIANNIRNKQQ